MKNFLTIKSFGIAAILLPAIILTGCKDSSNGGSNDEVPTIERTSLSHNQSDVERNKNVEGTFI